MDISPLCFLKQGVSSILYLTILLFLYLRLSNQHKSNVSFSCAFFTEDLRKLIAACGCLPLVLPYPRNCWSSQARIWNTLHRSNGTTLQCSDHVCFPGSSRKQVGSRRPISDTDVCLTQVGEQETCI